MKRQSATTIWILVATVTLACVGSAAAGTYVEQKVSSSQKGMNMKVQAWMEGDSGKVEFVKSDSDITPKGSYLLSNDGGETTYLINPKKKTYSPWDIDALFATLGELSKGAEGILDIDFKNLETEDLGTEPGGEMLGAEMTKKSWRTAYTMEMKVVFMERKRHIGTTIEAWLTNDVSIPTLNNIWFSVNPPTTGDPDFDRVLTAGMERIDGTPLKVVTNTTMTEKKGKRGKNNKVTMEVTALREESVDSSMFVMPEGYDEVLLFDLGAATGNADGADRTESEDTEGDPLEDLGGLFDDKE